MKNIFLLLLGIRFSFCLLAQSPVALQLPTGFTAQAVALNQGRVRHIAIAPNGTLYLKLERLRNGAGIVRLRDLNQDGVYEDSLLFGNYIGTGIALKNNFLYASSNNAIFRYALDRNYEPLQPEKPERLVYGLVDKGQHASKSITLDNAGNIYVNIGAPSNICQVEDRKAGSPGRMPCPILDSAGGIWQFSASALDQTYAQGTRYATGLRNVVGLDWNNEVNDLYVTVHGRDLLFQHFPQLYDAKAGAELPAETFYRLKKGQDAGWPYVYWDQFKKKKILSPEFGGDGVKEGAPQAVDPLMGFPGHLAPNALLFYTGTQFPKRYRNGAFIAFHGSWNRNPEFQEGFYIVFVPMKNGVPTGEWEIFADGFTGKEKIMSPREAQHRPCGLAQTADGSLLVSDDVRGWVWKVTFSQK
ncbi:MAG: PQQ-dependent sugar dehydrogenase [Bacteroidetes bacterium]|nr:PQQ-dependent sugar dehydrogenase [Bacteroidota bacterium]